MRLFTRLVTAVVALVASMGVCGYTPPLHATGAVVARTGQQDHRLYAFRKAIQYLNPNRTPYLQIMSRLRVENVNDYEYKVFERDWPSRWIRAAAAHNDSVTTLTVASSAPFRVDDVIYMPAGDEMMLVTAIASATTLTVQRGYGGSTAVAHLDNDWVEILFSREEEMDVKPGLITTLTATVTNFAQIFKRGWAQSNTRKAMKFRTNPHSLTEEKKISMGMMKEDEEHAYLWGKKSEVLASGKYTWMTGGINEFVVTNRVNLYGGLGFGDIPSIMARATKFGSEKKIWLCGRDFRQQLDGLGLEYRRITGSATKLGFKVDGWTSSFGDAMFVTHFGLTNAHAGTCIVLDPKHSRIAQLRSLTVERNVQNPGVDGEEHYAIKQTGLWIDQELAHMILYNATTKLA